MSKIIMVPTECIWLRPDQVHHVADAEDAERLRQGHATQTGLPAIHRDPKLGPGEYAIENGVGCFVTCRAAGVKHVKCAIEGPTWFDTLREQEDPMDWAKLALALESAGYGLEVVIHESQLPRSVCMDRLHTWKSVQKRKQPIIFNQACKYRDCGLDVVDGEAHCSNHRSPKARGLVLCLEPGCKVWIKPGREDAHGQVHFCKPHRRKTYEAHPLRDRDGDPIWIGARFTVTKMASMETSHVLNCISMLEAQAQRRQEITGHPKEETLAEHPRYRLLVDELKQRDRCKKCRGGIAGQIESASMDDPHTGVYTITYTPRFCTCPLGQEKLAAHQVAEQAQGKSHRAIIALILAAVTAIICAPATSHVAMGFLAAVHERLRAMGVLR